MRVYLAGPDVFFPNASEVAERKKELCARQGFEGVFPTDDVVWSRPRDLSESKKIARICVLHMNSCEIGVFNLTPWRGPSADVGTVFELGWMAAHNKACFGYSNDQRNYDEKVYALKSQTLADREDVINMQVENFGLPDNLMICEALTKPMVRGKVTNDYYTDLWAFEDCLKLIRYSL